MITTYTNVLLLHYNNYFNRQVKQESSVLAYMAADTTDYGTASAFAHYADCSNINFNPSDGIETSLILGFSLNPEIKNDYDYCVVYKYEDDDEQHTITRTIISRWFVMDMVRTREGQYELSLKRDVIVDNYNNVINAPCFIEKAIIANVQNPLLYNRENFEVNQIKTSEYLLKDRSNTAWVVGYVSSKLSSEAKNIQVTTIPLNSSGVASGSFVYTVSASFTKIYISYGGTTIYGGETGFSYTFNASTGILTYSINVAAWANKTVEMRVIYTNAPTISSKNYKTVIPGDDSRTHLEDAPYDMFCIPFGEITLNTANINTTADAALEIAFEFSKDLGSVGLYDIQLLPYCPRLDMVVSGRIYESLGINGADYSYITEANGSTVKSIVLWCKKSTFSITATPSSAIKINRPINNTLITTTVSSTNARCTTNGGYSSVSITDSNIKNRANVTVTGVQVSKDSYSASSTSISEFDYNEDTGYIMGKISTPDFPTGSTTGWTATISYTYNNYIYPEYLDRKISNECDVYRLTSPNYNGQFEWSLAKSSGTANTFDVDCTYKPFQPYIHVQPLFTNLYGTDFDDARGLICGGDFSLPVTTDAWTNYQVQNKTYQEMFDRQIQNMDVQNIVAGGQAAIQAVTGTITGAIGGGIAGGKIGGGGGAAAGAILGGGASLTGGIADYQNTLKMQQENRSYAVDMYNYGLKNVQALPYGLTKVSAYNANNKIFPMVEYFTCTDVEKQALRDKITYNGMNVGIISPMSSYIVSNDQRFIKGQIIRLSSLKEDNHMAMEIYNEINKGVYI